MPFLHITDSKRTASHAADQPRTHFFRPWKCFWNPPLPHLIQHEMNCYYLIRAPVAQMQLD